MKINIFKNFRDNLKRSYKLYNNIMLDMLVRSGKISGYEAIKIKKGEIKNYDQLMEQRFPSSQIMLLDRDCDDDIENLGYVEVKKRR